MKADDFESRFEKAWASSMNAEEINALCAEASKSQDPVIAAAKILISYQKNALKSVLKEFLLDDPQ